MGEDASFAGRPSRALAGPKGTSGGGPEGRRPPRLFAVRGRLWGWVSAPARVQPECPLRTKRSSPNLRGGSSCSLGGQLEGEGQRQHWKDASELAHGAPPARNCPNLRGQPECPLRTKRSSPNLRGGSSCSLGGQLEGEGQRQHWKDASELAHGAPPARTCAVNRSAPLQAGKGEGLCWGGGKGGPRP